MRDTRSVSANAARRRQLRSASSRGRDDPLHNAVGLRVPSRPAALLPSPASLSSQRPAAAQAGAQLHRIDLGVTRSRFTVDKISELSG